MADSQAKCDWMKANTTVFTIKLNHRTEKSPVCFGQTGRIG